MLKNNKGITLIVLSVMIIIILILASVATYYGISNIQSSKFQRLSVQVQTMQLKINDLYEEYSSKNTITINNEEKNLNELGESIEGEAEAARNTLQEVQNKGIDIGEETDYRYYSSEYIQNELGLEGISNSFLVNVNNRMAIIYNGYEYNDKIYYVLKDFENNIYNVDYKGFNYEVYDDILCSIIKINNIAFTESFSEYNIKYKEQSDIEWKVINNINYQDNKSYQMEFYKKGIYMVAIYITKDGSMKDIIEYDHILVNPKESKANVPEIEDGMIPVKWNAGNLSWVKADINNSNNDWYDYTSKKMWANMVTVNKNGTYTRDFYKNAEVGTEILMSDINTMFVWIPRFTYKVGESSNEIIFSNGKQDANGDSITNVNLFSSKSINGIWIGKYECSKSIQENIEIKPDKNSWKNISFDNAKALCTNMAVIKDNIYGLDTNNVTTSIMSNNAWESVKDFSNTIYGNNNMWNNSYYEGIDSEGSFITRTGMAGEEINSYTNESFMKNSKKENTGRITLKDSSNNEISYYEYWTENGGNASTTGNAYGIFDMVGGASEYTYGISTDNTIELEARGGIFSNNSNNISFAENVDSSANQRCSYRVMLTCENMSNEYNDANFIQSTGVQYIDTGYIPNQNTRAVFDGMVVDGDTALFGARRTADSLGYVLQYTNKNVYTTSFGSTQLEIDAKYKINQRYTFDLDKNKLYINDNTTKYLVATHNQEIFTSSCSLALFGVNINGIGENLGTVRCCSCQIYDEDTLVRDFKPVINSDGKICLLNLSFDKSNVLTGEKYYYNNGEGNFCHGNIQLVEDTISAIGIVNENSGSLIEYANNLYKELESTLKQEVSNYSLLENALVEYSNLSNI